MILLKFLRRRTSLDEGVSAADLAENEFKMPCGEADLSPSVYEIEDMPSVVVRALAEHGANAGLGPPGCRSGGGIDLSGALPRQPVATPESSHFSFIREAHREGRLQDRGELLALLEVVVEAKTARVRRSSKETVRAYVRERFSEGDSEWDAFGRDASNGRKWRDWAVK